jgi:hypothetical protein
VRSDVLDGFTTIDLAERDYGVVIDPETMELDAEATVRLREERSAVPELAKELPEPPRSSLRPGARSARRSPFSG